MGFNSLLTFIPLSSHTFILEGSGSFTSKPFSSLGNYLGPFDLPF